MHNMYNMRHHLSAFWNRLAGSTLCELSDLFADKVPEPELEYLDVKPIVYRRDRIFTPWRTFWMFTGQKAVGSGNLFTIYRRFLLL